MTKEGHMFGRLVKLQPVVITTVKDSTNPEDYGVKMSVLQYEGGYQICRHFSRTHSNICVNQTAFKTATDAIGWARSRYLCGDKFDV
jgi:hypothetical protein